ncbi:MAG: YciI family protein [Dehalococcoidia bacterium]
MKYLLFYEGNPAAAGRIPEAYPRHAARIPEFQARGLIMIGPYADRSGALAIFTGAESARAFAEGDPFVTEGIVASWSIKEWAEAIGAAGA